MIGKLIHEMSEIGSSASNEFDPEGLKQVSDLFRESMARAQQKLFESLPVSESRRKRPHNVRRVSELMGIYYYHLCRKHAEASD